MKLRSQLPILAAMGDKPPLTKSALPLLGEAKCTQLRLGKFATPDPTG